MTARVNRGLVLAPAHGDFVGVSMRRVLDPLDRITEILFGVIMVLTFTGAVGVATAERVDVREMLAAALGCNIAWGIIDAGMYLMARVQERGRILLALRALRGTADEVAGRRIIEGALPPLLAPLFSRDQIDAVRVALSRGPEPDYPRLTRRDAAGAFETFLLIFLSTVPIAIPFAVIGDLKLALRLSNCVAVLILFVCGYQFGRLSGLRPWPTGLCMVLIGVLLVGLTIALGG